MTYYQYALYDLIIITDLFEISENIYELLQLINSKLVSNGKVLISELSGSESLIHFTNGNLNWVSLSNGIQQKNIGENTKLFMNVDEFLYFDENNRLVNHG